MIRIWLVTKHISGLTPPTMDADFGPSQSNPQSLERSSTLKLASDKDEECTRSRRVGLSRPASCHLVALCISQLTHFDVHFCCGDRNRLLSVDTVQLIQLLVVELLSLITTVLLIFVVAVLGRGFAFPFTSG